MSPKLKAFLGLSVTTAVVLFGFQNCGGEQQQADSKNREVAVIAGNNGSSGTTSNTPPNGNSENSTSESQPQVKASAPREPASANVATSSVGSNLNHGAPAPQHYIAVSLDPDTPKVKDGGTLKLTATSIDSEDNAVDYEWTFNGKPIGNHSPRLSITNIPITYNGLPVAVTATDIVTGVSSSASVTIDVDPNSDLTCQLDASCF